MKSEGLRPTLPEWPNLIIRGAQPDEPDQGQPEGTPSGSAGGTTSGSEPKGDTGEIRDPQARISALEEEKTRHYTKLQEAQTELEELRQYRQQQEDAKLTAQQKVEKDLAAKETTIAQLTDANRRLAIENTFLIQNDVQWQSPAQALKLVDLSEVQVENGVVKNPDALKAAIKKLADESPWLLKAVEPPPASKSKTPPASGSAPQNPPQSNGLDATTLMEKFPALRR